MNIRLHPITLVLLEALLPLQLNAQRLFEPWTGYGAVHLPQVHGVAAWADMHGSSNEYPISHSEYLQDLAVAGRDSAGNPVTAIHHAINLSPYFGDFTPPSADPSVASYSQNLSPAIAGRSIAWCDYNNDGFPDLAVAGENAEGVGRVVLYQNRPRAGAASPPFRELAEDALATHSINLAAPGTSLVLWLDYDNDGKTDLLTSGLPNGENAHATRMFRNTGGGFSRDGNADSALMQGMLIHSMRAADFDLDSDPDLLFSDFAGNVTVFENHGNGTFSQFAQPCRQGAFALPGKAVWADLNRDRHPDIVMAGRTPGAGGQPALRFSLNIPAAGGGRAFTEPATIGDAIGSGSLPPLMVELATGDMNHDGLADIVVAGYDADDAPAFRIYRPSFAQDGTLTVTADPLSASYQPRIAGSAPENVGGLVARGAWSSLSLGHFESASCGATADSLDVMLLGSANGAPASLLLCNSNSAITDAPTGLVSAKASMTKEGNIHFQWGESGEAAARSLTQALHVRRFSADPAGSHYDVSPGFRTITGEGFVTNRPTLPQAGNAGGAGFWDWKNHMLTPGDRLYWEVTPVNARYAISPGIGAKRTFRVPFLAPVDGFPADAASSIAVRGGSAWADIDGDGDVDGIIGASAGTVLWMNAGGGNFIRTPGAGAFGSAARYEWGDVNGDGRMDLLASRMPDNGIYVGGIFRNLGGMDGNIRFSAFEPFAGENNCLDAKFADCDLDGDLDVALLRLNVAPRILINQGEASPDDRLGRRRWVGGNGPGPLIAYGNFYGSASWADVDNDHRPDLLVSGYHAGGVWRAKIYRNAGMLANGVVDFRELAAPDVPQVEASRPSWGDVDGDGYLDFFIGGLTYSLADSGDHAVMLNRPDGNGGRTFVRAARETGFDGSRITEELSACESLWADFNNDGWLDLAAFSGMSKSIYLSQMVDGVRTLVRAEPLSSGSYDDPAEAGTDVLPGDLPGADVPGLAAMDADGDGRMDLLVGTTGGGNSGYAIYHNFFDCDPLPPPAAPEAITAAYDTQNDRLRLDWDLAPRARCYNLLVRESAGEAAVLPLQSGNFPERWPVFGQTWTLSGFRPLIGRTYQLGVQGVDQNRRVSAITLAEVDFPAALVGTVRYMAPAWPLLERRLGSPAGIRVYADLDDDHSWDGESDEPSALTDQNGAYRIALASSGSIHVRLAGLCPAGGQLLAPGPVDVAEDDGGREIPVGDFQVTDAFEVEASVFFDRDRDGIHDVGEETLDGWVLTLDADRNGVMDAGEQSHESGGVFTCLTDPALLQAGGQPDTAFLFSRSAQAPPPQDWLVLLQGAAGVAGHDYQFPQGVPETLALEAERHITMPAAAASRVLLEVGVWSQPRTVYGHVIHDRNSDGDWDVMNGEPGLDDWEVLLDFDNDGLLDPDLGEMAVSTSGGSFVFQSVTPGRDYQIAVRSPDETWTRSFPSEETVVARVRTDNVTGMDFGYYQPGAGEDAPLDQADAMKDPDGNGAPKVLDYLFGRAVRGQPLRDLSMTGAAGLLARNNTLPLRTDCQYHVLRFRVRPSHAGINYTIHAASALDEDPDKELAWREISATSTGDGMIEREIVILPAIPTRITPRLPDPQAPPPSRAFIRLKVDLSALPPGSSTNP